MQGVRQFGNALTLALFSVGLVLGGLSLSLVEFPRTAPPTVTEFLPPSPLPLTATATFPPPLESPTPTFTPFPTLTAPPPPSCPIPTGWIGITVPAGETLESLAVDYRSTAEQLRAGNCLVSSSLVPNSIIYVPNVPANTPVACIPGAVGWSRNYVVKAGDTLFHIATQYYTQTTTLKQVNCHPSDRINVGDLLWVPLRATRTPTPTVPPFANTFTPYPTDPLTETVLPFTGTPSATDVPPLPTGTPSSTPVPPTPSITAFPNQ